MGIEVNFEGKIALITGASSGLGARFAKVLAKAGCQVVLASRRIERLKELRAEIEADGGAAHVVAVDVTDHASIKSAIAHAETEAGPIRARHPSQGSPLSDDGPPAAVATGDTPCHVWRGFRTRRRRGDGRPRFRHGYLRNRWVLDRADDKAAKWDRLER